MRKFYYKNVEGDKNHEVEILHDDIVKVNSSWMRPEWLRYNRDKLYKIVAIQNISTSVDFGTCAVIDTKTYTSGYDSVSINDLVFVTRKFKDPEDILP